MLITSAMTGRTTRYNPRTCSVTAVHVEPDRVLLRMDDSVNDEAWMEISVTRETLVALLAEIERIDDRLGKTIDSLPHRVPR